jgi:hypothetical protein
MYRGVRGDVVRIVRIPVLNPIHVSRDFLGGVGDDAARYRAGVILTEPIVIFDIYGSVAAGAGEQTEHAGKQPNDRRVDAKNDIHDYLRMFRPNSGGLLFCLADESGASSRRIHPDSAFDALATAKVKDGKSWDRLQGEGNFLSFIPMSVMLRGLIRRIAAARGAGRSCNLKFDVGNF